jgi:hypothetical protein
MKSRWVYGRPGAFRRRSPFYVLADECVFPGNQLVISHVAFKGIMTTGHCARRPRRDDSQLVRREYLEKYKKKNMTEIHPWQARAVEQLGQLFENDPDARVFVLAGSLADTEVEDDFWSDVDVKVVLADPSVDRYYLSVAWLHLFGRLICMERHEDQVTKTLRVCLDGFRRFDLVFIPESACQNPSSRDQNLFRPPYTVVWSRLPDFKADLKPNLETQIASLPASAEFQDISGAEIEHMADHFWFKAAVAIAKVARNDLLIGLHLALDLARDCLVLQMIRRDQVMGTNIHHTGGWGNELVERFSWDGQECSPVKILDLITRICETFDKLALELSSSYHLRGPLLFPTIERARMEVN